MRWEIEIPEQDGDGDYQWSGNGLKELLRQLCAIVGHGPCLWAEAPGDGVLPSPKQELRCCFCHSRVRQGERIRLF